MISKKQCWLTVRELQMIPFLIQGKLRREIGKALGVSEGTIKNKISRAAERLGLQDGAGTGYQLVLHYFKNRGFYDEIPEDDFDFVGARSGGVRARLQPRPTSQFHASNNGHDTTTAGGD